MKLMKLRIKYIYKIVILLVAQSDLRLNTPTEAIGQHIVFALDNFKLYLNTCIARAHLMMRRLSILDLSRNRRGWWSVSSTNSRPYRYGYNFFVAHTNAKHSCSIVEYLRSVSLSFLLMYITGNRSPSCSCISTPPIPSWHASVHRMNCLSNCGSFNTGLEAILHFSNLNAFSAASHHFNWFGCPFLVMSVRGLAIVENLSRNFL